MRRTCLMVVSLLSATGAVCVATAGAAPLRVAAGRAMRITVVLAPRNPSELTRLARAVADPGSPQYRAFLSRAQFAARFAPRAATVRAVEASLRAHGLTPGRVSANGLAISVRARTGATEATAAVMSPAAGRAVAASIQAIIGLTGDNHQSSDRVTLPARSGPSRRPGARTTAHVATGGPAPCPTAARNAPEQSAYTSDQIAEAYGFAGVYGTGDQGAGVTIAVYELEADAPSDIAVFQRCYGTDTQISYVPVDGGVHSGPGSGEAALDIEQLISLAPQAKLIVYQAPNSNSNGPGAGPYDVLNTIVSQDAASVISDSWGQCEHEEGRADAAAENVLLEEAAVQGQTMVASAGDSGSEDCDVGGGRAGNTSLAVDDPASQPFVTGVGGTTLTAIGPPPSETAWNSSGQTSSVLGGAGAGGGGLSSLWPMPSYQSGAPAALAVTGSLSSGSPCAAVTGFCREVPDVSADADPNYGYLIYYNGSGARSDAPSGWQGTGGTSAAAPLWAAVVGLADADRACAGLSIGFANPTLYALAAASPGVYFHDVTSGNNDLTGTAGGLYPATPGYDMATGLGSPDVATLVPALCADTLRLTGPRAERTFTHVGVRLGVRIAAPVGTTVSYSVHGLPRGVRFDPTTVSIAGNPRHAGRFQVRIRVTDSGGGARVLRFRWTVANRPRITAASVADRTTPPSLSLTVRSGTDESGLRTLAVRLPSGLRVSRSLDQVVLMGPRGRALRFTASLRRGTLRLRLRAPSRSVRLVLADGALHAATGVSGQSTGGGTARLVVTVRSVDADGGRATVTALLHART